MSTTKPSSETYLDPSNFEYAVTRPAKLRKKKHKETTTQKRGVQRTCDATLTHSEESKPVFVLFSLREGGGGGGV